MSKVYFFETYMYELGTCIGNNSLQLIDRFCEQPSSYLIFGICYEASTLVLVVGVEIAMKLSLATRSS